MKKPRIALLVCGHLRSFSQFREIYYRNIIRPLKLWSDLDIFVSTWDKANPIDSHAYTDNQEALKLNNITITEENIREWFSPVDLIIENFEFNRWSFLLKHFSEYEPYTFDSSAYYKNGILFTIPQYWRIYYCNELKKKHEDFYGFKYDFVIRARPDFYPPDPIIDFTDFPRDRLYLSLFHYGLAVDSFAVGPSNLMDDYCSIFKELPRIFEERFDLGGERTYWRYLKSKNVPVEEKTILSPIRFNPLVHPAK